MNYYDFVIRAGLFYEKFTATPFTGEVNEGRARGSFKNGKHEGSWEFYMINGQIWKKGDYKNGKTDGYRVHYNVEGTATVIKRRTGTFKNGVKGSD